MSDSDDDDFGPMPARPDDNPRPRKRTKYNASDERIYLNQLPCTDVYEKSFMHRDTLSFVVVTKTEFVVTASVDGHLKFWKKSDDGIEFVKHFRAHLGEISGISTNAQGTLLVTISPTKELKIFDVLQFDMINMIQLDFTPGCVAWVYQPDQAYFTVAVSDANSGAIHLFDAKGDGKPLHTVSLHRRPVAVMAYNAHHNTVVSIDTAGMMEYWVPEAPEFSVPTAPAVSWRFKSDTDLFEFCKNKGSIPSSLNFSPDGALFVTYGLADRQVRVWRFATGKLYRKYDESLAVVAEMQQAGTAAKKIDDMEFGRRMAMERELEANAQASRYVNAVFDASSTFVLYATPLGVKIVHVAASKVSALIGDAETLRFLNLALYQGAPKAKKVRSIAMAASDNPALADASLVDPMLVTTSFKKNRFYLFTRRAPSEDAGTAGDGGVGRDAFNEKPTKEELTVAAIKPARGQLAEVAVLHTTMGDITLRLFADHTPKTVENWVTLAKNNYYNGLLFHRVIKEFMLQTGDPKGDGTGGESCWGGEFEDEIVGNLKHDRPGTLAMANAGPGSQFYLTTVACPWLDGKHTVFGRVTAGLDIVHAIENTPVDKQDRPLRDVSITSISIK
ncbi:peptidyl-prolyl cis-trans isomerase cyp15 [Blastocladiella britannica]|nr:peptidyl-prolyl cis-trans isomerase cyp15 [Blastocladiella britannica]